MVRGSGINTSIALLAIATLVTALFPDGRIDQIGPIRPQPELRVLLIVPVLLAAASALSHPPHASPIIAEGPRSLAARVVAHMIVLAGSVAVSVLANLLGSHGVGLAFLRNTLWMAALACAWAALFGTATSWCPVFVALGWAVVSPASEASFSIHAMTFDEQAVGGQLLVASLLFAGAALLQCANPRGYGYLSSGRRRRQRTVPRLCTT